MLLFSLPLSVSLLAGCIASVVASPLAAPAPTAPPTPTLVKKATSCTFSGSAGAASASQSQASCATIVLSNVAVPSGTTLDLSKLNADTAVGYALTSPNNQDQFHARI